MTLPRACALMLALALAGCLSRPAVPEPARYDLGIAAAGDEVIQAGQAEAVRLRTRIHARPWLDDTSMHYRLQYANELQVHAYAYARWAAPPAEMLAQRLEQRLARGPRPSEAGTWTVLDVEIEEFVQVFESPDASIGRVTVHAQLAGASPRHATFSEQVHATSPDAAGGARALAAASDALISRLLQWIEGRESNMTTDDGKPRLASIEEMLEAHWLQRTTY